MPSDDIDQELSELYVSAATDMLLWDEEDAELGPALFAASIFLQQEAKKMMKTELERLFDEAVRSSAVVPAVAPEHLIPDSDTAALKENDLKNRAEADAIRATQELDAATFIANFLGEMYRAPLVARANSRRAMLFDILYAAVDECGFHDEEFGDGGALYDLMKLDLAGAEMNVFIEPNDALFRKKVGGAFGRALKSGLDFVRLAAEIKDQRDLEAIRKIRMKLRTRKLRNQGSAGQ